MKPGWPSFPVDPYGGDPDDLSDGPGNFYGDPPLSSYSDYEPEPEPEPEEESAWDIIQDDEA